jgi:D-proline reductase (dithiol) PrdB
MLPARRLKNRLIAKVITRFPGLAKVFVDSFKRWESGDIPWTSLKKPLNESTVAVVTTAGVHRKDQRPFNMNDPNGDPAYREVGSDIPVNELMITHDYYDHTDADKDINIVYPVTRLKELVAEGIIGNVAKTNYSFMGHIDGPHLYTLMSVTAPEVSSHLYRQGVDCVLLTPG